MFGVHAGVSRPLRVAVWGLATILAVAAIGTEPADAARRHHKRSSGKEYNPPTASIVVDANSGKVMQQSNPDGLRHPASLTKVMTLYVLFERLEAGKIKLGSELTVSAKAAAQAPSKLGLKPGDTISVEDAIKAVVTKSANDIAVVIAEALGGDEDSFARLMTRKAHALGMEHTVYVNASGLPDDEQITTARDQALLGRAIQDRFPKYYRYFSTPSFTYHGVAMRNHNHLLGRVEGVDGIKTGYVRASGFNLVTSVHRGDRRLVAVVMGGRSAGERDSRMRDLIERYIASASNKRTAPLVAEAPEAAEPKGKATTYVTASVPTPAARSEPAGAGLLVTPAPGSSDPIKPLLVKTISVKAPTQAAPSAKGETTVAAVTANAPASSPPLPPPGARPGILGVLPASAVNAAAQAEQAPAAQAYAAPALDGSRAVSSARNDVGTPARSEAPSSPPATHSGWMIQVGAFDAEDEARQRLASARQLAKSLLGHADPFTETVVKGDRTYYRARFAGLEKDQAEAACKHLKRNDIACMPIKN